MFCVLKWVLKKYHYFKGKKKIIMLINVMNEIENPFLYIYDWTLFDKTKPYKCWTMNEEKDSLKWFVESINFGITCTRRVLKSMTFSPWTVTIYLFSYIFSVREWMTQVVILRMIRFIDSDSNDTDTTEWAYLNYRLFRLMSSIMNR